MEGAFECTPYVKKYVKKCISLQSDLSAFILLPPFQNNSSSRFVLSQTCLGLTKSTEKYAKIYDTKYA